MARRTLDVSALPDFDISAHAPLWWGQLCLCFIEGTMFCILIAMYFYIRLSMDMWPPPGTQLPHLIAPTIALIVLLLSVPPAYWASESAKKNDRRGIILGLGLNLAFAIVFLLLRLSELLSLNFKWDTDIHGSIFWTIVGLHTFDMVADLMFTLVLLFLAVIGWRSPRQRLGVHVDSVVWYFLVLMWIPMYAVVYWGPRYVGAP